MKKTMAIATGLLASVLVCAQTPNPVCAYCGEPVGTTHKQGCIYSLQETAEDVSSSPLSAADTFIVDFNNKEQILQFENPKVKECALGEWDENHDGELTVGEAEKVTRLWLMFPNRRDMFVIADYSDLRFFPHLEYLHAGNAWHVDTIDLSHNPQLKEVNLYHANVKVVRYAEGLTMVPKPSDDPWDRARDINFDTPGTFVRADLIDKSKDPENVEILDFTPKDSTMLPRRIGNFTPLRLFPRLRILRTGAAYTDTLDLSQNTLIEEVDASLCLRLTTIVLAKGQNPRIIMPKHRNKGRKPRIIRLE